jgi:hypothetical protein
MMGLTSMEAIIVAELLETRNQTTPSQHGCHQEQRVVVEDGIYPFRESAMHWKPMGKMK